MNRLLGVLRAARRPRPAVGQTPADEVLRENKWRLLRYRPRAEGPAWRTPVLLVPSLINRHYVLDLMPGKSFAEWMVARGHDVYVLDWGTPGPEDRYLAFDDFADRYLGRALRHVARTAPDDKAHLFGYCLGGTLTAIHAAARPEHVASLTALAAPIRFADAGIMATWVRSPSFSIDALVNAFGNVPWPLMQLSFHMLRPTLTLAKAVAVLDRAWNDEFMDGFLALETWGNDNVSFPGEAYRRYIRELYQQDQLVNGTFHLSGRPARLPDVKCPTLCVTFEHDNIVPKASATALLEQIGSSDKQHLHLNGGHVGAVVSKSAAAGLWPKISDFWAARDAAARVAPAAAKAKGAAAANGVAHAAAPAAAPAAAAPAAAAAAPAAAPATSAPRGPRSRRSDPRP